jgi:hypothetical protein
MKAPKNIFEIKTHKGNFSDTVYACIYRDGEKTNFWCNVSDNEEVIKLEKCLHLLRRGVISSKADDICAHVTFKARRVIVCNFDNVDAELRQQYGYKNELFGISGNSTEGREQELIERARAPIHTQYCKIINNDLTELRKDVLCVLYPFGASYYAI